MNRSVFCLGALLVGAGCAETPSNQTATKTSNTAVVEEPVETTPTVTTPTLTASNTTPQPNTVTQATDASSKLSVGPVPRKGNSRRLASELTGVSAPSTDLGKAQTIEDLKNARATSQPAAPDGVFYVRVEPSTLDLGDVAANISAKGTVKLTNVSEKDVRISDCKTSCGCTTTNCPRGQILAAGDSTEVEVSINTGPTARRFSKVVTFMIDGQQPIRMPVSAMVIEYVAIKPAALDRTQSVDGKITITAKDETPFRILSASPAVVDGISSEAKTVHEVFLSWDAWDELGDGALPKLSFAIDHPKVQTLQTYVRLNRARNVKKGLTDNGVVNTPLAPPAADQRLSVAMKYGDTQAIKAALAEVNDQATRDNMLALAARRGRIDAIDLLIDVGAAINSKDGNGRTPLMSAAQSRGANAVDVIKHLVSRGADIGARDSANATALTRSAGPFGTTEVVKVLLAAKADVNVVDSRGQSPLIWAARFGDAAKVDLLLAAGADVSVVDATGNNAVYYATKRRDDAGKQIAILLGDATGSTGNADG